MKLMNLLSRGFLRDAPTRLLLSAQLDRNRLNFFSFQFFNTALSPPNPSDLSIARSVVRSALLLPLSHPLELISCRSKDPSDGRSIADRFDYLSVGDQVLPKMSDYGHGRRGGRDHDRRGGRSGDEGNPDERDRRTALQRLDSIQDPGKRYLLRECIGSGVCGDVFEAIDQHAGKLSPSNDRNRMKPESSRYSRKQKSRGEDSKAHARVAVAHHRGV